MKNFKETIVMALLVPALINCDTMNKKNVENLKAPVAEKVAEELVAHGDTRIDNYFWMRLTDEQKNAKQPDAQTQQVLDYLNAENDYTEKMMARTKDFQEALFEEIKGRIKQQDESVPYFKNDYWYYMRYETGYEYPVYCRKHKTLEADEEIMLNVNQMAQGHEYYNIAGLSVSPDNKWLAYSEDTVSRRIYTIRFKNLMTGEILTDKIPNVQGETAWANDSKTVFYTSKNEVTLLSEKIKRHIIGEEVSEDVVVYHEKDPSFYIGVWRSKSGKYIIIGGNSTISNDYRILRTDDPYGEFKQFTSREDIEYSIDHFEDKFFIKTNWDAQNFRLMETDENKTAKENWKEVIAHREDVLLEGIEVFNDFLVVDERKDGLTNLRIINHKTGDEHYLDFGESAYMAYISTNPEFSSDWLRFGYTSLTTPNSTFDYNMIYQGTCAQKAAGSCRWA